MLVSRARGSGNSGALIVSGEAGVGKSALLNRVVDLAGPDVRIERMVASESEMELTYAGLQLMCGQMMAAAADLPPPQREALETAFGLRGAGAPNPLLVGLGVLGLLDRCAGDGALVCVVDDAQWLDGVSARAMASVARRLEQRGRRGRDGDARGRRAVRRPAAAGGRAASATTTRASCCGIALPGALDQRVRDQLIAESRGNPLALRELPRSLSPAELAGGFALASSMPLEGRIEQSLLARVGAAAAADSHAAPPGRRRPDR